MPRESLLESQTHHRMEDDREPTPSQDAGFVDRRPAQLAQQELASLAQSSPRLSTQRALAGIALPPKIRVGQEQAVQRKVAMTSPEALEAPDGLAYVKSRLARFIPEPATLLATVMSTKPPAVQDAMRIAFPSKIDFSHVAQWVDAWNMAEGSYSYTDDERGLTKLGKDAIKFHLNTSHRWRSVGTAEYMTGDATGLAMAPTVDPVLSIKVLTGDQRKAPLHPTTITDQNRQIIGPSFLTKTRQLPGYFDEAHANKQIILSDTEPKTHYKGTSDRYSQTYNREVDKKTRIEAGRSVKPWNHETYEATRVIGEAYLDPNRRQKIMDQMLPSEEHKQAVKAYKTARLDPSLQGKPCLILWGRNSGANGGAHKELDSHPAMVKQLATFLSKAFSGRTIVFVGDEVISDVELSAAGAGNQTVHLGAFWRPDRAGDEHAPALRDRNAQRHLFQLLASENAAISIGMRSGSLEGMALLGLPVIFIDDKGNNAAGRMEYWAGKAADKRGEKMGEPILENLSTWEREMNGPMPNYKRLATHHMLGDEITKREALLEQGKELFSGLLTQYDHAGQSVCTPTGSADGKKLTDRMADNEKYRGLFSSSEIPASPAVIRDFLGEYGNLVNVISNQNLKGKAARNDPAYHFDKAEIGRVRTALSEHPTPALVKNALAVLTELEENAGNIVGEGPSSESATAFLAPLLNATGSDGITEKMLNTFMSQHRSRKSAYNGMAFAAKAGTLKLVDTHIQMLLNASNLLLAHNVLQPDELRQIEFLVNYLGPNQPDQQNSGPVTANE